MNPKSQLALDKMKHLLGMAQQESQFMEKVALPLARGIAVTLLENGITEQKAVAHLTECVSDAQMHMASLEETKDDMTVQLEIAISSAEEGEERKEAAHSGSAMLLEFLSALRAAFQAAEGITVFLNKASGPQEER